MDVVSKHDAILIITGQYRDLRPTPHATGLLAPFGPVIKPTPDILLFIEQEKQRYVAVLHVTS